MKKYFYTPVLVALLTAFTTVRAQDRQDYLGLPGDNLNLFAVMKLFQESETLEGFERNLNDQNNYINNLDLNADGYVDYIRVIDNIERNVHFIVLQVSINPKENQDVAVFTVVQESNGQVSIQLVGDEALYGRNYIVEPIYDETPNPGYTARRVNGQRVTIVHTNTYEVAAWPLIRFIYMPNYVVWHSPWYWDYYPVYWRPWNPFYWHHYYGYHYNYSSWYYGHYRHWDHHRYDYWHSTYYTHHHHYSPYVHTRINDGYYKRTYSKPESRHEGIALYQRTRSAGGGSATSVNSSGGRRTSSGGTAGQSTRTSQGREATTSGSRTSGSRQGTGTRQTTTSGTRQSTSTGTRQSTSGNDERRSTSSGSNRESSVRTETRSNPTGTTRQSSTTTTTKRSTTTTSRESNAPRETEARSSERRTSGSSGGSSSSGQSVSKSTTQRSGSSASSSGRRSSDNGSSGSETKETKSSSKTSRSSGRR